MMGTGKTTVGRALAERLGRPFRDSDAEIEARTGRTVAQIFADEGEAAFRARRGRGAGRGPRRRPTRRSSPRPAARSSTRRNRALLRAAGTVVWLRAPSTCWSTGWPPARTVPRSRPTPQGTLARMETDRDALYAEVADVVVDSTRPVEDLVEPRSSPWCASGRGSSR